MRVLFLTNFYQVGYGGEEQSCHQVVEGLQQRNHATMVLTSMYQAGNHPVESDGVSRSLYLEMDLVPWRNAITFFTSRQAREKHNLLCLESLVERFNPDIIFVWGMWNLHRSLPAYVESKFPEKVVYRFATYWPTLPGQNEVYWRTPGRNRYSRLMKQALGSIALKMLAREQSRPTLAYKHSMCVSAAARDELVKAGVPVSHARIIYTGLDEQKFVNSEKKPLKANGSELKLLYAGRLAPDKSIETAIKAMSKLVFNFGRQEIRLSLVGSGASDYENYLRQLVNQENLAEFVFFLGWHAPDRIPALMRDYDAILVTSTWAEPFARVVVEGMLSGLVVVATPTGGTPEIIQDGANGLFFKPEDPHDLARKIMLIRDDPLLCSRLVEAGKHTVREKFTVKKMMDEIENFLQEVAGNSTHGHSRPGSTASISSAPGGTAEALDTRRAVYSGGSN